MKRIRHILKQKIKEASANIIEFEKDITEAEAFAVHGRNAIISEKKLIVECRAALKKLS